MAVRRHVAALSSLRDRVHVAAAWSPTTARRDAFAATYGLPVVDDVAAILEDRRIDLVFVLTPPLSHLDVVERCARAGKAILLEKPADVTAERAKALVALCHNLGVRLAVCFQNRFRDTYRHLESIIKEKRLGTLIAASAYVPWWRSAAYYAEKGRGQKAHDGGGVLLNQGIHTLDQLVQLAGIPFEVSAYCATSPMRAIDTEDIAVAALRWETGTLGTIQATTAAFPGTPERIELIGTAGTAILTRGELSARFHDGQSIHAREADLPPAEDILPHIRIISDMLDAMENNREPLTSGARSIGVQSLVDAMLKSAQEGSSVYVS
ncbi:Gfo/Idh/MocA family oxidoreductase [Chelatococcus sp. YT9]|nr:Gfo/Idh/MocA family oxidoreductase [Chelatococcus sp. YT9]